MPFFLALFLPLCSMRDVLTRTEKTMKTIIVSLMMCSSIPVVAQQAQAVTAATVSPQTLYERGLVAMNQGDVITAEKNLRAALQAQPQHPHARYSLNQLLLHRDKIAARYRENMMKQTKIAKVEYADASITECLDSLSSLVKTATAQKFTPNFIIKDPGAKLSSRRVTLNLSNIPASQVLAYIASFAQCTIVYEEHAILVEAK
jgi:hypothetical protein